MNNLHSEAVRNYIPAPEEIELHDKLEPWAQSLVDRYDVKGLLKVLPYDPEAYPFQRLGSTLVPSYQPSKEEEAKYGSRQAIQERILEEGRLGSSLVLGKDIYNDLVDALVTHKFRPPNPSPTLKAIWARIHTGGVAKENNNVGIWTRHDHVMDTVLAQKALVDAFARSPFMSDWGGFDLFEFSKMNVITVGEVMTRLEFAGQPVVDTLSRTSNVALVLPPDRAIDYGVSRRTIVDFGRQAESDRSRLASAAKEGRHSLLNHVAPIGTTSEKVRDLEGNLLSIKSKKVATSTVKKLAGADHFVWPINIWVDERQKAASFHLGSITTIYQPQQVYKIMERMTKTTEHLSGVFVEENGQTSLGSVAIDST